MDMLFTIFLSSLLYGLCSGHGRLVDPPGRASAFRYGFNTPANYDDNQLYCGGKQVQWERNGGRCGVCGDPYDGPREHEAGGRFATGTIVRNYRPGQVIQAKVELTANHKGWMEFRLCVNNNPNKRVTQRCLDRWLLPLANGSGTRLRVTSDMRMVSVGLRLPQDLTCSQCLLQWKYNAGNSWGTDSRTGESCVGCGPQEQFYGCADVSIGSSSPRTRIRNQNNNQGRSSSRREEFPPRRNVYPPSRGSFPQSRPRLFPGRQEQPNRPMNQRFSLNNNRRGIASNQGGTRQINTGSSTRGCKASAEWQSNPGMDVWCQNNCAQGHCPSSHCMCN